MAYDALLLSVVWFVTAFAFTVLTGYPRRPELRPLLQLLLLAVSAGYFVGFWCKGGQTPAMKTWRLKLVQHDHTRISTAKAFLRFVLAGVGIAAFGASLLWALFDADKQFLHDRLAGTRIIRA
jgi:uncharacterized RDD family membrane protein YckC